MKKFTGFIAAMTVVACAGGYFIHTDEVQPEAKEVERPAASMQSEAAVSTNSSETRQLDEIMTRDEVTRDLKFMMMALEKFHPAWGADGDEQMTARVKAQYEAELKQLTPEMTLLEEWQACSRIVHEMRDAHTRVAVVRNNGDYEYPVRGQILAINGEPVEKISKRFLDLWPYELESYGLTRFEKYIPYKEYMQLVGIDIEGGVDITYLNEEGEKTEHIEPVLFKDRSGEFLEYKIDREHDLGIFKMDSCKYNNEQYHRALAIFFDAVKKQHISHVALDLRENNGGWIPVIKEFMAYIDVDSYQYCNNFETRKGAAWIKEAELVENNKSDKAFDGKLYVLTSPRTFSAAMDFAMVIKDNGLGEIVGDIPGNLPDCYTQNVKYQLPNSRLRISISSARQNRIDESKKGEVLYPDYQVEASKALDKVYELIQ